MSYANDCTGHSDVPAVKLVLHVKQCFPEGFRWLVGGGEAVRCRMSDCQSKYSRGVGQGSLHCLEGLVTGGLGSMKQSLYKGTFY